MAFRFGSGATVGYQNEFGDKYGGEFRSAPRERPEHLLYYALFKTPFHPFRPPQRHSTLSTNTRFHPTTHSDLYSACQDPSPTPQDPNRVSTLSHFLRNGITPVSTTATNSTLPTKTHFNPITHSDLYPTAKTRTLSAKTRTRVSTLSRSLRSAIPPVSTPVASRYPIHKHTLSPYHTFRPLPDCQDPNPKRQDPNPIVYPIALSSKRDSTRFDHRNATLPYPHPHAHTLPHIQTSTRTPSPYPNPRTLPTPVLP